MTFPCICSFSSCFPERNANLVVGPVHAIRAMEAQALLTTMTAANVFGMIDLLACGRKYNYKNSGGKQTG